MISSSGVVIGEQRAGREKHRTDDGVDDHDVAEAERPDDAGSQRLHAHGADGRRERHQARAERRQAEADLHQQRQQKRQRADAEPEQEAAVDAGAQRRQPQQREVQHRRGGAFGMDHIERHRDRRRCRSAPITTHHGSRLRPATERPKAMPPSPMPASSMPYKSKRSRILAADRIDVAHRHEDAEHADRNVDQEDPVPGEIGGDEAAERRPDHRPDQGRHRDPRHRVDQRALVDRAQQHEPPDRRHHRAAQPLQRCARARNP